MVKKAEQNKLTSGNGVSLEHHVIEDDTLLPSADELMKLNDISPGIVEWIMNRAEIEQNARIEFNKQRVEITKKEVMHIHRYNTIALCMAFILAVSFLSLSFYLMYTSHEILGSIFVGSTMIAIVSYFIKAKNRTVR